MRRVRWVFLATVVALVTTLALDGLAPLGRLALKAGYPQIAARLLTDPGWKGHAQYLTGDFATAAETQRGAGPDGYFHRANALARSGSLILAAQVYDAHLYRIPADTEARANHELISDLAAVIGEGVDGPGSGMPFETIEAARPELTPEQIWREAGGRMRRNDREVQANRQWLASMSDTPGLYMRKVIAAERERREREGQHQPPMENPW